MNFKRPFHGETQNRVPKRRLDLMSRFIGNASFSLEDLAKRMEPWMREVVREECHRMIPIFGGSSSKILNNPIQNNGEEAGLALKFATNLPESVFTGNKIQADDSSRVLIELIDSRSGSRITTGPLSSLKIDIVALEGDFDPDESKFNDKIVVQREGRRPLLNGDLTVTLTHGRGCLENVTFTDNSIWSRCRKFKLGARVSRKSHVGEPIREASSRAFVVKDHRGKLSEKHHPPYPNDEVWRLKKIGKDGKYCSRLALEGIKTVKDLLRLREINSSMLKKILSGDGSEIPNRAWETIVGHAAECKIDDNEMYVYSSPASENPKLFFDQVYRVLGATFDGQEYCPVEKLNVPQTILVQNLKREAFENVNLITLARRTSAAAAGNSRELTCSADERYFSDLLEVPVPQRSDDVLPPTATDNFTTTVDNMWSGSLHEVGPPPIFEDQIGPQFHVSSNFVSSQPWMTDHFNGLFFSEMDFGDFSCSPSNLTFCVGPSHEAGPSNPRSRAGWCKIRAALKWRSVGRNLVATRQEVFCR